MNDINLKAGSLITIEYEKKPGNIISLNTLLEKKYDDENFLVMAPMQYGTPILLNDSDVFKVIYTHITEDNRFETYEFKAKSVERIRVDNLPYIKINRISNVDKKQRRGFFRLDYMKEVLCKVEKGKDEYEDLTVTTKDISGGGMRFLVNKKLPKKSKVIVFIDTGSKVLQVKGSIITIDKVEDSIINYVARVEFTNNAKGVITDLVRFILKIQSEYLKKAANSKHENRMDAMGGSIYYEGDRRNYKDWLTSLLDISVVGLLFLSFIIFVNFLLARPEWRFGIQKFWGYEVRKTWDKLILYRNMKLFIGMFIVSSISLFLNMFRLKRKGDRYRMTLVISAIVSLVALIIYRIFWGQLIN